MLSFLITCTIARKREGMPSRWQRVSVSMRMCGCWESGPNSQLPASMAVHELPSGRAGDYCYFPRLVTSLPQSQRVRYAFHCLLSVHSRVVVTLIASPCSLTNFEKTDRRNKADKYLPPGVRDGWTDRHTDGSSYGFLLFLAGSDTLFFSSRSDIPGSPNTQLNRELEIRK